MISINEYGFTDFFKSQLENFDLENKIIGRVTEVHKNLYKVITDLGETKAILKRSLLKNITESNQYPVVGDFVLINYNPIGDSWITNIFERKSKFSRTDYSGHSGDYGETASEQIVASNFDYIFILASLNDDYNIKRIERYLVSAWESGGIPIIILTKSDLLENYDKKVKLLEEVTIGVDVIPISSKENLGLENLNKYFEKGKTIVLLGSSGVGKSSLVNRLLEKEIMLVKEIREDDSKGKHTTTHRQLFMLENKSMIIDTPGMRELGMWNISEGLKETFSDVEEFFLECKFSDCSHTTEPGCGILKAIENGQLEKSRWKHYLKLKRESEYTENKSNYLRKKSSFHKSISKNFRNYKKKVKKIY